MSANCSTCHGTGKEKCKRCGATGEMNCYHCHGTGRVVCEHCRGLGKRIRYVNPKLYDKKDLYWVHVGPKKGCAYIKTDVECPYCHDDRQDCYDDEIKDEIWSQASVVCESCGGTGKVKCSRCHGTKMQKCSECQEREDKARQAILAAQQKAKERAEARMGCGCLLIICAFICLVIWGPEWFAGTWIGSVLGWIRHASWVVIQWLWSAVKVIFGIIAACCMMIVGLVVALISMFIG